MQTQKPQDNNIQKKVERHVSSFQFSPFDRCTQLNRTQIDSNQLKLLSKLHLPISLVVPFLFKKTRQGHWHTRMKKHAPEVRSQVQRVTCNINQNSLLFVSSSRTFVGFYFHTRYLLHYATRLLESTTYLL